MHDTPQENGITERLNCTILEKVHAMLHSVQLPKYLWGEALMHAVWLKNQTSTKALETTTPLQALMGAKPDLSELQEWGKKVSVHDSANSKLSGGAKEGRWVGFDIESKASCIYWPDRVTISIKCNVRFTRDYVLVPSSLPTTNSVPTEPTANTDSPDSVPQATADAEVLTHSTGETQGRGTRVKCPSQYIQGIHTGEGTTTGATAGSHVECRAC